MICVIRVIFLLFLFISLGATQLENAPHYNEIVSRFSQSLIQNWTSQIVDFQSILESMDYLDYQRKIFGKYSTNPSLIDAIRKLSLFDVCTWFDPGVSHRCCSDLRTVLMSLLSKEMWAIKMIDSCGKIPSGIFFGDVFFPGSFDECLSIAAIPNDAEKHFNPKYCQIGIHLPMSTTLFNPKGLLTIGVCVPNSCSVSDIKFMFHTGISLSTFWFGGKDHTFVCHEEQILTIQAIVSLAMCGLVVVLLIVGTAYDVIGRQLAKLARLAKLQKTKSPLTNLQRPRKPESLEMTTIQSTSTSNPDDEQTNSTQLETTQSSKKMGKIGKFLVCFSLSKNARKLLNTDLPEDSLAPIHGIRFISMTWIILGHTYVFGATFWRNNNFFLKKVISFEFQAIGNATVSVDSFFLISGLLVVYVGLKTMKEETGNKDWLFYYVHRFWRLTPTYAFVMLIYILLMQYWGDGPYWPQKGIEPNYCRHNWWQNLLYINNFFDTQCMGWMWYLANDMQFYIISPIFLLLLKKKPLRGLILMLLMLIGQFLITSFIWTKKPRDPRIDNDPEIYMRPYNRIGPYLVGMAYGYFLHRINCKMTINRFLSVLLWLVAIACAVAVLYGRYGNYHDDLMTKEEAALYTAVHRSVWAIAVGWVICACVTGYGGFVNRFLSWKAFVPLSRLTYSAYLIHPIVIFTYYFRQRFPMYVTHFRAVHIYFGNLCFSYLIAFVISMAMEAPTIAMEKMLRQKKTAEMTTKL